MTGIPGVRAARAADAPGLQALNMRVAADALEFLAYDTDPVSGAEMLQAKLGALDLSGEGDGVLVADDGAGAIVGACLLRRHAHPAFQGVLQLAVSVDPDWRRRGVGRMLVDGGIGVATAAKARRIQLAVVDGNGPALALFRAVGFQIEGRLVGAAVIAGQARDVLAMARAI